jgi:hypothetical protein
MNGPLPARLIGCLPDGHAAQANNGKTTELHFPALVRSLKLPQDYTNAHWCLSLCCDAQRSRSEAGDDHCIGGNL